MITVLIPSQKEFKMYKNECKKLYVTLQDKITDDSSFEFITTQTFFFIFISDEKLIGAIYYFVKEDGKLYLNGFAKRKMHELCVKCLKMSLNWFKGNVYAEAQNRASALCLLRCGFKRVQGKIFVWRGNGTITPKRIIS